MPYPVTPTSEGIISITISLTLISSFLYIYALLISPIATAIKAIQSTISKTLVPTYSPYCNHTFSALIFRNTSAFVTRSSSLPAIATVNHRIEKNVIARNIFWYIFLLSSTYIARNAAITPIRYAEKLSICGGIIYKTSIIVI